MRAPRDLAMVLTPLVLLGALTGCSQQDEPATATALATALQPGAPGEDNTVVTAVDQDMVMGAATAADVAFLQQMIVHHSQAIAMVELVEDELGDAEVAAIARRIRAAQRPEIATMTSWLEAREEQVPAEPGTHEMAGHDMPGMASAAQLTALGEATGGAAQVMFLELMIAHHQGALEMATAQASDGRDVLVTELADEMFVEQQAEIGRMQDIRRRLTG